jgi:hypothetical protein
MRQQGIFLLAILCFIASERALSTELWIQPRDESGRMLRLSRAEVYLDIWGHGKKVTLVQNDRGVRLPLDQSWPCSVWPDICGKNALCGARLILQAEGYTTVTSRIFYPFGTQSPAAGPTGTTVDTITISFQGVPEVRLKEGDTKELKIPFRRPAPKVLRVIDEQGKPLSGIQIWDQLLFAQSNHCGAVEGETLVQSETNAAGEVNIPDVNGECAFSMENLRHYALQESWKAEVPIVAIRQVQTPVTTIVLRALEKRSLLQLEFTNSSLPAAGLQLISCFNVACGTGCGTIQGETDQNGRVLLKDYYPEEMFLILRDHSDKVYWQGNAPEPAKSGWTKVEISK